jgi:hypothetical protein
MSFFALASTVSTVLSSSSVGDLQGIGNAVPCWQDDAKSIARVPQAGNGREFEIHSRLHPESVRKCAGAGWKQRFILGHAGDARFDFSRGVTSAQP